MKDQGIFIKTNPPLNKKEYNWEEKCLKAF